MKTQYFNFGEIVMTHGVSLELEMEEVIQLLTWHGQLKQGELSETDYQENWNAMRTNERIFNAYMLNGQKYYVITEWDRSVTTVLKPEEY